MLGRNLLPYFVLGLIYLAPSLMHLRDISYNSHAAERKVSWYQALSSGMLTFPCSPFQLCKGWYVSAGLTREE